MIKKAELHVHLEGTITPKLALELARRNKLELPDDLIAADGASYDYSNFLDFLKKYDAVAAVIRAPQDYYDITFDYLKNNAQQGAIYIELMYSPEHAEMMSKIPSREHLYAIQQAIDDAYNKYTIIAKIIITAVRHFGVNAAIAVAKQAIKEEFACIVGFGLAGDEINFPPKLFAHAFQIAVDGGLLATVHAGEHASASGMIEAMDYLPIKRIGHGVNAIHSQETMSRIRDNQIALEVCPSSNVALKVVPDLPRHPLKRLRDAGILVSINSDDPPFFRTDLAREYKLVQETFGYTDQEMLQFTQMAIAASFANAATKNKLQQCLMDESLCI